SSTGKPILEDAAGLLAFRVLSPKHIDVPPNTTGRIEVFNLNKPSLGLSAAAIYARGAPTSTFEWNFGDGTDNVVTSHPLVLHKYKPVRPGKIIHVNLKI